MAGTSPAMTTSMSLDVYFLLVLAVRMAVAAAFVIAASMITERSGPAIGALVATLPISAGHTDAEIDEVIAAVRAFHEG